MPTDPTHGTTPIYGSQTWNLDQLGNWGNVTNDGSTDTRTHNFQNEVTGTTAGAIGYDNNGNLTSQAGYATNTYDAWNRATSIRGVSYSYDALGRRVWESAGGGRAFLYSGQQMIETRTGAVGALASTAQEQYVYGMGYVDEVVLRDRAADGSGGDLGMTGSGLNERLYYQQDREFNVTGLVSQAGAVVERYAYDPYGSVSVLDASWNLLNSGSAVVNQVGFTGRWLDGTGMWYFRARYLEPVLGRFVSRDPMPHPDLYAAYFVPGGLDPNGDTDIKVAFMGAGMAINGQDAWATDVQKSGAKAFASTDITGAVDYILKELDTNKDGKYDCSDLKDGKQPKSIGIVGFSWGGYSVYGALSYINDQKRFVIKPQAYIGSLDPVSTGRGAIRQGGGVDFINDGRIRVLAISAVNFYETNGIDPNHGSGFPGVPNNAFAGNSVPWANPNTDLTLTRDSKGDLIDHIDLGYDKDGAQYRKAVLDTLSK